MQSHVEVGTRLLGLFVPGREGLLGVANVIMIPREGRKLVGIVLLAGMPVGLPVCVARVNRVLSLAS